MTCQIFATICAQDYTVYIYADDSKIYRHVLTSEDQQKLQNDIHRVTDWADKWLLKLNVDKCCGMSFAANVNSLRDRHYYIEHDKTRYELIKVDSFSNFGVRFDSKLCFFG